MSKIIKSQAVANAKPVTIQIRPLVELEPLPVKEIETEEDESIKVQQNIQAAQEEAERQLQQAQEEATRIREEAEAEAERIYEQLEIERKVAQEEMEQAIKAGQEQGYTDGYEQGRIDGQKEYEELIEHAKTIVETSEQQFEKTIESAEPVIIELATELARRVIGKRLSEDETIWSSMLEQLMTEVREHEQVKLYVHPNWYEQTTNQREELEQLLSRTEKLFIYPDAGLSENGCIVETKYGRIDATIDRQLHELKTQLLAKLEEGTNES